MDDNDFLYPIKESTLTFCNSNKNYYKFTVISIWSEKQNKTKTKQNTHTHTHTHNLHKHNQIFQKQSSDQNSKQKQRKRKKNKTTTTKKKNFRLKKNIAKPWAEIILFTPAENNIKSSFFF